jgi:hypothetical protein
VATFMTAFAVWFPNDTTSSIAVGARPTHGSS